MRRLLFVSSVCVVLVSACKNTDGGSVDESALRSADADGPSGACDADKLKALMQALATAAPGVRSELVADRLGDVCELPPPVKSFFAATTAASEDADGPAAQKRAQKAVADARAALEVICPDAQQVRTAQATVAANERQALLFDSCDFQRFKLVDRESWLRGDPSSPVPFFAFEWLVQQGISDGEAKVLAGLMVVRDRKRWGLPDQTLPQVEQGLAPIPAGVVVHISPTHISFQGQKLVSIKDGQLDPSAVQGHLVGPLFDQLAAAADKHKQLAESASREWSGTLVVVADASTPQHVLIRVLFSAGQAEFSRYALVAQSAPQSYGAVLVDPPKFSAGPQPHKPAEFLVGVSADGFRVRSSTSTEGATLIPGLEGGTWDFGGLTAAAEEHKAAHPKATVARVRGEDSTTFGTFTQALAAVSGPRCHTAEGACLLPGLVIEAGGGTVDPEAAARAAGILGVLGAGTQGELEGVFNSSGLDAEIGAGGLGDVIGASGAGGAGEGLGLGDIGLIGRGGGGGEGSGFGGSGAKFGEGRATSPRVRSGKASVGTGLSKEVVRRIVRAHLSEVRFCYEKGLVDDETLAGAVTIDFMIDAKGSVSAAKVAKDELADESVGTCIRKAVRRWKFPKPSATKVDVSYPFSLEPG